MVRSLIVFMSVSFTLIALGGVLHIYAFEHQETQNRRMQQFAPLFAQQRNPLRETAQIQHFKQAQPTEQAVWETLNTWYAQTMPQSGHCKIGLSTVEDPEKDALLGYEIDCLVYTRANRPNKKNQGDGFVHFKNIEIFKAEQPQRKPGMQHKAAASKTRADSPDEQGSDTAQSQASGWFESSKGRKVFNKEKMQWVAQ